MSLGQALTSPLGTGNGRGPEHDLHCGALGLVATDMRCPAMAIQPTPGGGDKLLSAELYNLSAAAGAQHLYLRNVAMAAISREHWWHVAGKVCQAWRWMHCALQCRLARACMGWRVGIADDAAQQCHLPL